MTTSRQKYMPERLMLDVTQAAELCGVSVPTFEEWVETGIVPKPADLPLRKRLWHREVLNEAMRKRMPGANDREARRREWETSRKDRPAHAR